MRAEIRHKPDYAALTVHLSQGEQVIAESGAMLGMSPGVQLETALQGGVLGALQRAAGGESAFLNTYTATGDGQRLDLAPGSPGDIVEIALDGGAVAVQRGSFLACTPGVSVDTRWGGLSTLRAGEGLFMLHCHGRGTLWVSSYGAVQEHIVDGRYVVDTAHIVAFDSTLTFQVRSVGTMKSLLFSSEGRVCEFQGAGRVWFQTRSALSLAAFLHPFRRSASSGN